MTESSIVRQNLMDDVNYRPYCGAFDKRCTLPRTQYRTIDSQFICSECGWVSSFPEDFIKRYKEKHSL